MTGPTRTPRPRPTKPAGWIYMQHTAADPHKYVGQSARPVWNRVNEERRTHPWGPDILPGRDGYTILRRVESLGDPVLDAIALDLAEAEEIRRWHPTENANRPDPAVFRRRLDAARTGAPQPAVGRPAAAPPRPFQAVVVDDNGDPLRAATTRRPAAPRVARARVPQVSWRGVGFAVLAVLWGFAAARVAAATPIPWAPWVAVPVVALLGPPVTAHVVSGWFRPRRRRRKRR